MNLNPDTRASLILRLRDSDDQAAWNEFVQIYEPLILRLTSRFGMQPADASEATQEVLLQITKVVEKWSPDRSKGTFRGWLSTVARNVITRFLQRQKSFANKNGIAIGDTAFHESIKQIPEHSELDSETYDLEFRRQVFAWAIGEVKKRFNETTWKAFWLTQIENFDVAHAAHQLNISTGAVYIGRSRIMKSLRELVQRQIDDGWQAFENQQSFSRKVGEER